MLSPSLAWLRPYAPLATLDRARLDCDEPRESCAGASAPPGAAAADMKAKALLDAGTAAGAAAEAAYAGTVPGRDPVPSAAEGTGRAGAGGTASSYGGGAAAGEPLAAASASAA